MARFEMKNIFSWFKNALAYFYNTGVVAVNLESHRIGPWFTSPLSKILIPEYLSDVPDRVFEEPAPVRGTWRQV
jgi:hypothetical protein